MREKIHPQYVESTIICACGNSWKTRSTKSEVHLDICSRCHPYFTGEQRIVDTAGQVERFMRRVQGAQVQPRRKKAERRQEKIEERRRRDEMRESEEEVELSLGGEPTRPGAPERVAAVLGGDEGPAPEPAEGAAPAPTRPTE